MEDFIFVLCIHYYTELSKKKKDSFTEIVITWSKSYEILQIHTEIYLRELSIINIALYADLLLQLHVEV